MRTKTKSRSQRNENMPGTCSKSQMIFAHRPALAYVLGIAGLSTQEIVRGALPGYTHAGDSI
jgi:hypothetical protein